MCNTWTSLEIKKVEGKIEAALVVLSSYLLLVI